MTRAQFQLQVILVTVIYAIALMLGLILRATDVSSNNIYYSTYKDLIPLTIALPAAYLTYCIQRRASFLQFLRTAWSNLVKAVNSAILYAQNPAPEKKEYFDVLMSLRVAIDELRGIYRNVGEESGYHGLYPVSPILDIYNAIKEMNKFRPLSATEMKQHEDLSGKIFDKWKDVRRVLLSEIDRPYLTESDISRRSLDAGR